MKVTTTGRPRSAAAVTVSPSWLRSAKSGSRVPGGRSEPPQPAAAGASSPRVASHTPKTPAAAMTTSVVRASARRDMPAEYGGRMPPWVSKRRHGCLAQASCFREAAADRVADQLDAVAHAELAQQVGAMRLDGLLGQMQDLGDLLVRVRLGDQLQHLLLARRQRLFRTG